MIRSAAFRDCSSCDSLYSAQVAGAKAVWNIFRCFLNLGPLEKNATLSVHPTLESISLILLYAGTIQIHSSKK